MTRPELLDGKMSSNEAFYSAMGLSFRPEGRKEIARRLELQLGVNMHKVMEQAKKASTEPRAVNPIRRIVDLAMKPPIFDTDKVAVKPPQHLLSKPTDSKQRVEAWLRSVSDLSPTLYVEAIDEETGERSPENWLVKANNDSDGGVFLPEGFEFIIAYDQVQILTALLETVAVIHKNIA